MKKVLFISALCLLITTGCGGKKLVCTRQEDDLATTYEIKFESDKASSYTWTGVTDNEENAKDYCETVNFFKKNEGETVECSKNKIKFSSNKFDDLTMFKVEDYSYNGIKAFMEEEGYSCK